MYGQPEPSSALTACWFCGNRWGSCTCAFPKDVDDRGEPVDTSELPGFGVDGMWITSPNVSECTRFFVDPIAAYGAAFVTWVKQQPAILASISEEARRAIDRASTDAETTTVDLVIRIQVTDCPANVASLRAALENLAAVMAVQAEDGLWTLGHAEAETDDGQSEHVADIETARVHAVLIEGRDALIASPKGDA